MNNTSILQSFAITAYDTLYATAHTCLTDPRAQCIIAGTSIAIRGLRDTIATVNEEPQDGWRNRATRWVRIAAGVTTTCAGVAAAATGILGYTDYSPFPPNKPKENEDDCSTDFRLDADPDCIPKETDLDPCLFPYLGSDSLPNPDCFCPNQNTPKDIDVDCIFEIPEVRRNFHCSPGSHTILSPILGVRSFEREKAFADPVDSYVLKKLEQTLYDDEANGKIEEPYRGFRAAILSRPMKELETDYSDGLHKPLNELADAMYSRFLDRYRPYGIHEGNAILSLPREECFSRFGINTLGLTTAGVKIDLGRTEDEGLSAQAVICSDPESSLQDIEAHIPKGLIAIHELMHVEEMPIDSKASTELFTTTRNLIDLDTIYKQYYGKELSEEVDYRKYIRLEERSSNHCEDIPLGRFINFYRELEKTEGSLGAAYLSKKSMQLLTCTEDGVSRFASMAIMAHAFSKIFG